MKRYRVVNPIRFITFLVLLALLVVMGVSLIKFHTVEATEGDLREVKLTGIPQVYVSDKNLSKWTTEPTEDIKTETYTVTAYCSCEICCGKWAVGRSDIVIGAWGKELIPEYSVASPLPFGTKIDINGRVYEVMDRTSNWIADKYDNKIIDIYFSDHSTALQWGKQVIEIEILD